MDSEQLSQLVAEYLETTPKPTYIGFVDGHGSQIAAWAETIFGGAMLEPSNVHGRLLQLFKKAAHTQKVTPGANKDKCLERVRTALAVKKDVPSKTIMKIVRPSLGGMGVMTFTGVEAPYLQRTTAKLRLLKNVKPEQWNRKPRKKKRPPRRKSLAKLKNDAAVADPCLRRFATLCPEYFKTIQDMMASRHETDSQEGRHLLRLGKWAVMDAALAGIDVKIGGVGFSEVAHVVPKIAASCIKDLKPFSLLGDCRTALAELLSEGKIKCSHRGFFSYWMKKPEEGIPGELVMSVMTALHGDETASAGRALDVEAQTKFLVSRIMYDTISLLTRDLVSVFEYNHLFDSSVKTGLRRSDLTVAAHGWRGRKFGILVTEFERDSSPVHKDFEVCTAEAVLPLSIVRPSRHWQKFNPCLIQSCDHLYR
ncbi:hypothetical protein HK104_003600 [Borealophlyctis nickersoniae]|nr:hypothetical protein HK104_003600 [Borealophlyctis nickersoniae]